MPWFRVSGWKKHPRYRNSNSNSHRDSNSTQYLKQQPLPLLSPADPGPRNKTLSKHLSRKTTLGVGQLLLALFGTVLIFYVPMAFACRGDSSIAFITVSAKRNENTEYGSRPGMPRHVRGMWLLSVYPVEPGFLGVVRACIQQSPREMGWEHS